MYLLAWILLHWQLAFVVAVLLHGWVRPVLEVQCEGGAAVGHGWMIGQAVEQRTTNRIQQTKTTTGEAQGWKRCIYATTCASGILEACDVRQTHRRKTGEQRGRRKSWTASQPNRRHPILMPCDAGYRGGLAAAGPKFYSWPTRRRPALGHRTTSDWEWRRRRTRPSHIPGANAERRHTCVVDRLSAGPAGTWVHFRCERTRKRMRTCDCTAMRFADVCPLARNRQSMHSHIRNGMLPSY